MGQLCSPYIPVEACGRRHSANHLSLKCTLLGPDTLSNWQGRIVAYIQPCEHCRQEALLRAVLGDRHVRTAYAEATEATARHTQREMWEAFQATSSFRTPARISLSGVSPSLWLYAVSCCCCAPTQPDHPPWTAGPSIPHHRGGGGAHGAGAPAAAARSDLQRHLSQAGGRQPRRVRQGQVPTPHANLLVNSG